MGGDILRVGTSGLAAFKSALSTVGHNISNVNTEGYSRQRVDLVNRSGAASGAGFIGGGVSATNTRRFYEENAVLQVRNRTTAVEQSSIYYDLASQVDNLIADSKAGIAPSLSDFFNAVQAVADDPVSLPARSVMLSEANTLTDRFQLMYKWVDDLRNSTNARLENLVTDINSIADSVAQMNKDIKIALGQGGGRNPNDLLDRRDNLISQLAEKVQVNTVSQSDGTVNVFIGSGQSIVLGEQSMNLQTRPDPNDANNYEITYANNGVGSITFPITNSLKGGELGGVLDVRKNIIDTALNQLGRLAIGLATKFNEIQNQGMDLNDDLGVDFFKIPQPEVFANTNNTGSGVFSATISDISVLSAADYRLTLRNASTYKLENLQTGAIVDFNIPGDGPPFNFDGVDINLTAGTVNVGDVFQIRPTRNGARDIGVRIDDATRIAAASPIRSEAKIANLGNGKVSIATISDITNAVFTTTAKALSPPIMVQFDNTVAGAPLTYTLYDNSVPGAPVAMPGNTNIAYDPRVGADIFPTAAGLDYGYRARLTATPRPGDQFTFGYNSAGIGDNNNMLALSELQEQGIFSNGVATFNDTYSQFVVDIAHKTRTAEINRDAQQALLNQAKQFRDAISGVNLDEEAANLIQFQQAYAAAAQVVSASEQMFQTLISAVRR